jgi:hypothetical protein
MAKESSEFPTMFWLAVAWIALTFLKWGSTLDDGIRFLFRIGRDHIGEKTPYYSKYDVWQMQAGVWALIGLVIWGYILIQQASRLLRNRRTITNQDRDGDAGSSEQADSGKPDPTAS